MTRTACQTDDRSSAIPTTARTAQAITGATAAIHQGTAAAGRTLGATTGTLENIKAKAATVCLEAPARVRLLTRTPGAQPREGQELYGIVFVHKRVRFGVGDGDVVVQVLRHLWPVTQLLSFLHDVAPDFPRRPATGPLSRRSVRYTVVRLTPSTSAICATVPSCCSQNDRAVLQADGNLVEYISGAAAWSSHTSGHRGSRVTLQADGNLVVTDAAGKPLWASGTSRFHGTGMRLVVQSDGNVVLYQSATPRWSTRTHG